MKDQIRAKEIEVTYPKPPECFGQEDRFLVIVVATGAVKATNRSFKDGWVFDITIQSGK